MGHKMAIDNVAEMAHNKGRC